MANTANFKLMGLDGRNARNAVRDWYPACTSPRKHVRAARKANKLLRNVDCSKHAAGNRIPA